MTAKDREGKTPPRPLPSGRGDLRVEENSSQPLAAEDGNLRKGDGKSEDLSCADTPLPEGKSRRWFFSSWLSWDRFFLLRGWLLAVNMVFFGFCFGVISNYLAIYSKEVMGISGGTGTWFLLLAAGLMASRLQGARALREGRLVQNAARGICLSSVAYLLFVLVPNPFGYYASAILLGFGNGHMWPAFLNMIISMAHHNERGTANSTLLISWDVGIGLGVLVGGFVAEHAGYTTAFWSVAASQLAGMALFFLATRAAFLTNRL